MNKTEEDVRLCPDCEQPNVITDDFEKCAACGEGFIPEHAEKGQDNA